MDLKENPNYYFNEDFYKSKYLCFKCRKCFKRPIPQDVKGINEETKPAKCPECGELTNWIGPKFRPPKSNNIKAWKSIEVLHQIGALNFIGFGSNKISIPEGKQTLLSTLQEIKQNCEINIKKWSSFKHSETNSKQIKFYHEMIQKINTQMNTCR